MSILDLLMEKNTVTNGRDPNSTVHRIFNETFPIRTKVLSYQLIAEPVIYEEEVPVQDVHTEYVQTGIVGVDLNTNYSFIESFLSGMPAMTGDEKEDEAILNEENVYNLTPAQIAELSANENSFSIEDWSQAPSLHDLVRLYVFEVETKIHNDPHRKAPPEEDMAKLKLLRDKLEVVAEHVSKGVMDTGILTALLSERPSNAARPMRRRTKAANIVRSGANIDYAYEGSHEELGPYAFVRD